MDYSILSSAFQSTIHELMMDMLQKLSDSDEESSLVDSFLSKSFKNSTEISSSSSSSLKFSDLIKEAADKYGVNAELVEAVIQAESSFDADAISSAGAQGLMQLMPATAVDLGVTDSLDPAQNINGGTKYLCSLLDYYDNNLKLALAAYNSGAGTVDNYGGIPPFEETQTYVQRVLDIYNSNMSQKG